MKDDFKVFLESTALYPTDYWWRISYIEKHELELKLSIIWYRVQGVNTYQSLTVCYSRYTQLHTAIKKWKFPKIIVQNISTWIRTQRNPDLHSTGVSHTLFYQGLNPVRYRDPGALSLPASNRTKPSIHVEELNGIFIFADEQGLQTCIAPGLKNAVYPGYHSVPRRIREWGSRIRIDTPAPWTTEMPNPLKSHAICGLGTVLVL